MAKRRETKANRPPRVWGYMRLSKDEGELVCENPSCLTPGKIPRRWLPEDIVNPSLVCPHCGLENTKDTRPSSILTQQGAIARYRQYKLPDCPAEDMFAEIVSASVPFPNRPVAAEMLEQVERGDHIIVSKLDRGFRSLLDFVTQCDRWKERDITLHIADLGLDFNSGFGQMMMNILATFAEYERMMIVQRTKDGLQIRKDKGQRYCNEAKIGWKFQDVNGVKMIVPCEKERDIMRRIVKMKDAGWTYLEVASQFTKEKVPTRGARDGKWILTNVRLWNLRARELMKLGEL